MKQMEAPKCRVCEAHHWAREGCYGMLLNKTPTPTEAKGREAGRATRLPATGASGGACSPTTNTQREGRRVLKGSTGSAPPAKPTRTASTERANPPTPAKAPAEQATGEKPAGGTAKPRNAHKKKAKKP